jgi:hypothetical protein
MRTFVEEIDVSLRRNLIRAVFGVRPNVVLMAGCAAYVFLVPARRPSPVDHYQTAAPAWGADPVARFRSPKHSLGLRAGSGALARWHAEASY